MTLFALLVRIFVNPLSNVLQKRICVSGTGDSPGQSPLFVNFATYFLLGLLLIPLAWNVPWTKFPTAFWGNAALVGIFGAFGNGCLVKSLQSGELSVLGPVNAYKSVVGLIFGIFLLREIPGFAGLLGMSLIVAGSYFVLQAPGQGGRFSLSLFRRKDLRLRIAAMVFAAVEAIFVKKVILLSDPNVAFCLWCWSGAAFSLLFLPFQETVSWRREFRLGVGKIPLYLGLIVSVGLMQWSTNYVFDRMPVGYALALFQLSAVLSVFYGHIFFREEHILYKLLGSLVMIGGSVLIILGNR